MAKYQFRLARVRDLRRRRKEMLEAELGAALRDELAAQLALDQALADERRLVHAITVRQRAAVLDTGFLGETLGLLEDAAKVSARARRRLNAARERVTARRADLAAASRDEQVLTRLDDQRRTEFDLDQRQREQRGHDEMATVGHFRRSGGADDGE